MKTDIKILRGVTVYCQRNPCGKAATHLFSRGRDPIGAFCEGHAEEESRRIGIDLPTDKLKVLQTGR